MSYGKGVNNMSAVSSAERTLCPAVLPSRRKVGLVSAALACAAATCSQGALAQMERLNAQINATTNATAAASSADPNPDCTLIVPKLPANAIVAIWFGYNGGNLTLAPSQAGDLANNSCVNGSRGSVFGQYAYCNAPAFFTAANAAITAGKLAVPALGTAKDGRAC